MAIQPAVPDGLEALRRFWKADLVSGFLVFLIALPLCLGIAMASGFPPVAGVLTAIVGGLVTTFFGSAPLTIKGPAAGLIVIALGAVQELGHGDPVLGYRRALAVIAICGGLQIVFALTKAGSLGDFFPSSVVHGMLAAIGVIIFTKQSYTMIGTVAPKGEPLFQLLALPSHLRDFNPEVTLIGVASLAILFGWPWLPWKATKRVPGALVVVALAMGLGQLFDLGHEHHYAFQGHDFVVGPRFLVHLPRALWNAITLPLTDALLTSESFKYVVMFALVGTIESLLSAKAIDFLDKERQYDLNRDLLATGVGNLICGLIGGLPMISEIVRSSANLANGAKSRFANFFHGAFLLLFVATIPAILERLPLAALGAMLVYTGIRLASPKEFVHTYRIGREQLVVFLSTLIVTLATDLLVGVAVGIVVKTILVVWHGTPIRALFRPTIEIDATEDGIPRVKVKDAAVFASYLVLKKRLHALDGRRVILDLSEARFVDHTVMSHLRVVQQVWDEVGRTLTVVGLDGHRPLSAHELAARRLRTGNQKLGRSVP